MIKAIIFDFFGVICSDDYWRYVRQDRHADTAYRAYADEVNLGEIPWQTFVHMVADALGSTVKDVNGMYESAKIDPRMVGLIHVLHKTYKTALLTNAHHDFIDEMLVRSDLATLFDETIVSSRLGIVKPNPAIFEHALTKLGITAQEAVYIDDLQQHVTAAKALGVHAILFRDFQSLQTDLARILYHS